MPIIAVNARLDQIKEVDGILCNIIKRTEKLTLPDRVNRLLKELRIGQTIDFHSEFSDELPELDARMLALHYLHDHPLLIIGAVDVENGLIYRASSHVWQQRLSPLYIALPAVLGAILVYVFYTFFQPDPPHVLNFVKTYIALIAGGFAHGAVETVKQYRSSKGQTFTALGDLLMWVHVKEWSIIAGIMLLWIGFIGLVTLNQGLDWGTGFFVGYSIDSFIDLFLQRFTSVVSTRTDALRTQLMQPTGQRP